MLQLTPWSLGYKPTQLPKYNESVDPTQFLMTYEATIASARGDDPILAKSFVMACEGPATTWYSYLQPLSITSWFHLRERLKQDFSSLQESSYNFRRRVPMLLDGPGAPARLPSKIRSEEGTNSKFLRKSSNRKVHRWIATKPISFAPLQRATKVFGRAVLRSGKVHKVRCRPQKKS